MISAEERTSYCDEFGHTGTDVGVDSKCLHCDWLRGLCQHNDVWPAPKNGCARTGWGSASCKVGHARRHSKKLHPQLPLSLKKGLSICSIQSPGFEVFARDRLKLVELHLAVPVKIDLHPNGGIQIVHPVSTHIESF